MVDNQIKSLHFNVKVLTKLNHHIHENQNC